MRSSGSRHAASALVTTTVGVLPAFLFGGLAPLIRADVGFEARWVGIAVALYFGSSSLASYHAGRLAERLGSQHALWLGVGISTTVLLAIGLAGDSLWRLCLLMSLGGLGNATIQPAANLALARGVGHGRQGLAFGFKQAAIPIASSIGGFAVPVLGVTLGWRAAYIGAAGLALVAALLPLPDPVRGPRGRNGNRILSPLPVSLLLLAGGIGLASAAANATSAYLVEAATVVGWSPGEAGTILGIGGLLGIVARIGVGWYADRMVGGRLRLVASMMAVGAFGYGLLVFLDEPRVLVAALPLAFAAGWGYNGLFLYSVVRLHPEAPAAATGVTQVGAFGGAVVGPAAFGLVADATSYTVGWMMLAVFSALAALLIVAARRRIFRERDSAGGVARPA